MDKKLIFFEKGMDQMIKQQVEDYLYQQIPLTQAMGIRVEQASLDKVVLFAPLANNINHQKTVFGGSLHAVATLACWSLLYVNLKAISEARMQIVITKSEVNYRYPVDADFRAECVMPDSAIWQRFIHTLHLKGKARLSLSAKIDHRDRLCVDYRGIFAVI